LLNNGPQFTANQRADNSTERRCQHSDTNNNHRNHEPSGRVGQRHDIAETTVDKTSNTLNVQASLAFANTSIVISAMANAMATRGKSDSPTASMAPRQEV